MIYYTTIEEAQKILSKHQFEVFIKNPYEWAIATTINHKGEEGYELFKCNVFDLDLDLDSIDFIHKYK